MWFERLMGFCEKSPEQVRSKIAVEGKYLVSLANGRRYSFGSLDIPPLSDARTQATAALAAASGAIQLREEVADVKALHRDPANAGALFQVASQFNLLEMVSPDVTPEEGVSRYELDRTQGPACAVAAGAGTIYRNYFHPVNGRPGQTHDNQIDCLADLGQALGNDHSSLWQMRNGYALPTEMGLKEIDQKIARADPDEQDTLRQLLRVGIQRNTQVTLDDANHRVAQVYCSAVPVTYSGLPDDLWERFARLVLEAAYEATLLAGIINAANSGNRRVYLTLLGGGAFGNRKKWIIDAMARALSLCRNMPLDVVVVSYGHSDADVQRLVAGFS